MMERSATRVSFASNGFGLKWVDVNTKSWEIVDACGAGRHLVNRACRLADRGTKLEYRNGSTYTRIDATVEKMG